MQSIIGKLCSNLHQICCLRHHQMAQGQNWTESVLTKMSFCTLHRSTHQIKTARFRPSFPSIRLKNCRKLRTSKPFYFYLIGKKNLNFPALILAVKLEFKTKQIPLLQFVLYKIGKEKHFGESDG